MFKDEISSSQFGRYQATMQAAARMLDALAGYGIMDPAWAYTRARLGEIILIEEAAEVIDRHGLPAREPAINEVLDIIDERRVSYRPLGDVHVVER